RAECTFIVEDAQLWRRSKGYWSMSLDSIRKGTDPLFDDAFPARLRLGRGRLTVGDVFVCSTQQPHRPQCATDADQQHPHPLLLRDPSALPIEQGAFERLPAAFMPPATGIGHEPFLSRRQAGDHEPRNCTKAFTRQLVATDIRSALVSLPDAHLAQEAPVVGL